MKGINNYLTLAALLMAIGLIWNHSVQATQAAEGPKGDLEQWNRTVDLGGYTLEIQSNTTKAMKKFRFFKHHQRFVIRNKLLPNSAPIATSKVTTLGDLFSCDNITLANSEMLDQLDCRPLESFAISHGFDLVMKPSLRKALYVERLSFRIKRKVLNQSMLKGIQTALFYALKPASIEEGIKLAYGNHEVRNQQESDSASTVAGFYFESDVQFISQQVGCFGKVAAKLGEPLDKETDTGSIFDDLAAIMDQGFVLNIYDTTCRPLSLLQPISVDLSLSFVKQNQFPYLSLKNVISTSPFNQIFTYSGEIVQTRAKDETDPGVYNTSILLSSKSSIMPELEFQLEQKFVNEGKGIGWEEMHMVHEMLAAQVRANWTADSLFKKLDVFTSAQKSLLEQEAIPSLSVLYDDEPSSEFLSLTLKLNRNLFKSSNSPKGSANGPNHDEL